MNADDKMKMEMLDELEGAMDAHDEKSYADRKKSPKVAMVEEDTEMSTDSDGDKMIEKEVKVKAPAKEKRTYLNPGREDLLNEVELQSDASDPLLMHGQFAKRKG